MMSANEFTARIGPALDTGQPEALRSDQVMLMYYVVQAYVHALLGLLDNTLPSDPIHTIARDSLQAIQGLLVEEMGDVNTP